MDKLQRIRAMLLGEEETITRGKTSITIDPEHVEAEIRARALRDIIKNFEGPALPADKHLQEIR